MGNNKIICWVSGGVTSAVACKMAIEKYGIERCVCIFIDTKNEDEDTDRFIVDCERWYGCKIERISRFDSSDYENILDVWYKYNSLNVATGAVCSSELKRKVRLNIEKTLIFDSQIFGFDRSEAKRAKSMVLNYPDSKPEFPLLESNISKEECFELLNLYGVSPPRAYQYGFRNNNCFQTGCVQGGVGYWQKMRDEFPEKFDKMAKVEHDLTNRKGSPVTMLKDQSKKSKESGMFQVFLKPHPDYPKYKDLSMMQGRPVKPVFECNGFCGINDLSERNETEGELNYDNI